LDRGVFDVFGFLKKLTAAGYKGPIGLQCYQVPGDIEDNLRRSMGRDGASKFAWHDSVHKRPSSKGTTSSDR